MITLIINLLEDLFHVYLLCRMGDAGLSSDSMASNFDMHAFYLNFLKDIHDEQVFSQVHNIMMYSIWPVVLVEQ